MNWLNPALLYFAALAAVPIILHFLMRERVQKVAFSAVRFLKKQSREILSRRKWLEWLLTALRVVCVLLLVVAFARPFLADRALEAGPHARSLYVLLDTSRSMTYGSRFADAQKEALSIINGAGTDVAINVVTFAGSGDCQIAAADNAAQAAELINKARASGGGTDVLDALDKVLAKLAGGGTGEVHLVSDLQSSGISRSRDIRRLPQGYSFKVHAVGGEKIDSAGGIAVEGGAFSGDITPGDQNFNVSARIFNRGSAREVEAKLLVAGKQLSSKRVLIPQHDQAVVSLSGTLREIGEHEGQVVLSGAPAVLKDDDRFFFVVRVVKKVQIAVLNGHPSATPADDAAFYLVKAYNAGADSPFLARSHEKLPDLKDVDAVVLAGAAPIADADLKRLQRFVNDGGALIIAPSAELDAEKFNAGLGRVAPARLREWIAAKEMYLVAPENKHPLLGKLAGEGGGDFSAPKFQGAWSLKDSQEAEVVLRFNDQRPALLEKKLGKGAVLMLATSLDMRAGDLPLRALFVPLLRESMKFLLSRSDQSRALAMGETLAIPSGATLRLPDGSSQQNKEKDAATWIAGQPGVYSMEHDGRTTRYAVNAEAAESDLTSASAVELERMMENVPDVQIRNNDGRLERVMLAGDKLAAERQQNLGWWLLIAVLALVPFELWVAHLASKK